MGTSTIGNSDAIISERLNKLFVAQTARPLYIRRHQTLTINAIPARTARHRWNCHTSY